MIEIGFVFGCDELFVDWWMDDEFGVWSLGICDFMDDIGIGFGGVGLSGFVFLMEYCLGVFGVVGFIEDEIVGEFDVLYV